MKLAILIPEFPSQTHIFFWREIEALTALGHEITIFSTRRPRVKSVHEFAAAAERVTHYIFPPNLRTALRGVAYSPVGFIRICRYVLDLKESDINQRARVLAYSVCAAVLAELCRRAGVEHLHVHSCADAAHIAAMSHLLGGPSYSLTLHGDLPVYGVDHRLKMRGAAFVATAAKPLEQQVISSAGVQPERTYTIPMGVNTDRFVPSNSTRRGNRLCIVTVGRLAECKGHSIALRAIRRAVDAGVDVTYLVAGSGPDEPRIVNEVASLHLGTRVKLLGSLGETEVLGLLQHADAFVLSSIGVGEASPVAVMEAMSCGIPPVVSIIGGTPDMITDGVDGVLVPQADENALAAAIIRLAADPDERIRLGRAARQTAIRLFDTRETVFKLLAAMDRWCHSS